MKNRKSFKLNIILLLIVVVVASAFCGGCSFEYFNGIFESPIDTTPPTSQVRALSTSIELLNQKGISVNSVPISNGPYSVAEVAKKVSDSIVNLTVKMTDAISAGSGVLFAMDDTKYYIITNNHVIDGGVAVDCEFTDGTIKSATIIAKDADTDIGVISISKSGIDSAKYKTITVPNDEYEVRVGDTAIAIGNSLGELGGTVTSGIVSALDRQVNVQGVTMSLMQTDAAVNRGNSGGGLFDAYGQLIGIVNSKMASTGMEGLGFAIPVDLAVSTACDLITKGYVAGRPMIGVMIREVNSKAKMQNLIESLSEDTEEQNLWKSYFASTGNALGLYVADVTNTASGLKKGDYVISFAGKSVINQDDLSDLLAKKRAGDVVKIEVKRNGVRVSLLVELLEKTAQ